MTKPDPDSGPDFRKCASFARQRGQEMGTIFANLGLSGVEGEVNAPPAQRTTNGLLE